MKNQTKDILVVGFALFSMFFGAGNVIFPPYLGMGAGDQWIGAFACYYMADIGLALVALFAMLRLKCDDMDGFMHRTGKLPSLLLSSAIVLCIGPLLAIPRTAATTFEMTVLPFTNSINAIVFSVIFFAVVFALSIKESAVIDIVGKILTPTLFVGLLVLIIKGVVSPIGEVSTTVKFDNVVLEGILSGYQTLDVLAALVFGVILLNTVKDKGYKGDKDVSFIVGGAGVVAGVGLLIIYFGLTYLGATASEMYGLDVNRSVLIVDIVRMLLGNAGMIIFGLVVALACLTTAIALVSACGAHFSKASGGKLKYSHLVAATCIFSMVISNIGLDAIIAFAAPILNIVYPSALTLIILAFFNDKVKNDNVFKFAAAGALVISVCSTFNVSFVAKLPLAAMGFAWVVPTIICGIIGAFIKAGAHSSSH